MKNLTNIQALLLRRKNKVVLFADSKGHVPLNYVLTMSRNLESFGYTLSKDLINACTKLSPQNLIWLNEVLISEIKLLTGAHRHFAPMYPNFPNQVMEMSDCELYINAICHYWTNGEWTPPNEVKERFPLLDKIKLKKLELGSEDDLRTIFRQLLSSNVAWGVQDREDIEVLFDYLKDGDLSSYIPNVIPQKENMAAFTQVLIQKTDNAFDYIRLFATTATDVLRIAVAMSGGDVSLAEAAKFRNFSRAERILFLELLDKLNNPTEDMLRWKTRWIRLGEKLHSGEYIKRFPKAAEAFSVLRNNVKVETFNGAVEQALSEKDAVKAVQKLRTRAGDFARRLDHLLRLPDANHEHILKAFKEVSNKISTPVLLQVMTHFKHRNNQPDIRTFFPKGNIAKTISIDNNLSKLSVKTCDTVVNICEDTLVERFKALPSLGNCYLSTEMENYGVPFAMRSASKSLRTLVRGSRLSLPKNCNVLRFFCWWKNGKHRTDIDLSASMFDADFNYVDVLSYYSLKGYGGCHSGDIVDAPRGASEFIDVSLERCRERKIRYIVMTLHSYTSQPYCDLPECFAGFMSREIADSGEIYEPKTVTDRIDITSDTRCAIPMIIDVVDKKVIWCDLALKTTPSFGHNVHSSLKGINATLKSMVTMKKPNLYDLLSLHVKARGKLVNKIENAETVFSVENETPFHLEEISSKYMV